MTELKPCPFCGGEAMTTREFWEGAAPAGSEFADEAGCPDCNVWLPVEAWNTRRVGACHMNIIDEYECANGDESYLCECSECGSQEWEPAHDLPLYCRSCGRKVER